MSVDALLRFGPVGTAVLAVLPIGFAARYAFGRVLARLTIDSRPLNGDERARLQREYDAAGLPVADTLVATGVEKDLVALGGTPRGRVVVLSETTLETATEDELAGLAGIAAGQHEERFPELYSGFLVGASVALAVALGIDPSGFGSTLTPLLVVPALVSVPFVGFAVLRRKTYAVDAAAARRVGREPVRAAIGVVETKRLPDWVPAVIRPKPSVERRLERL